jgi:nucleoside-diphosphate-sugar epimerase
MTASGARPRLLVVGGSGFIGSHVVARGSELGWEVTSLGLRREPVAGAQVRQLRADIRDREALTAALAGGGFEYVVNCGGYIDHARFSSHGREIFGAHFTGLLNLTEALDRSELRMLVNIGSSDEYGGAPAPQREDQREEPISPYSLGKVGATQLLQMLYRTEKFPGATLRLFLTYGPGQGAERFLPQIIVGCARGESFPVSKGEQLRDFCFVSDTVDGIFAALTQPAAAGEVVNIASGAPVSIRSVVERIRAIVGKGEPRFGEVPYRTGENMQLYADITKAKRLLGWEPAVPLEVGLADTIRAVLTGA